MLKTFAFALLPVLAAPAAFAGHPQVSVEIKLESPRHHRDTVVVERYRGYDVQPVYDRYDPYYYDDGCDRTVVYQQRGRRYGHYKQVRHGHHFKKHKHAQKHFKQKHKHKQKRFKKQKKNKHKRNKRGRDHDVRHARW